MLQRIYVSNGRLVEYILKCTPVVQTTTHFRHKFVWNIHCKAAPLDSAVKNMAEVLFSLETSFAMFSNTLGTTKTQRSQSSWPKASNLFQEPIRNICRKFFLGWHDVYVPYIHIYSQVKSCNYFLYSNFTTPDMPLRKTVRFFSDQGLRNRKPEAQISSRESGTGLVQRIAYKGYRLGAMG